MVADLFSLLAQGASTERQAEKGTKDSRDVGTGKAGKRLVRRLEQTSSVCLRRQLPRRGSRERNERQPRRWNGKSGEKVGVAVGADLFSLLAQTASPKGEAGKGRIAQSASTERKAEKETKDSRGVGKGKAGKRWVRRLEQPSSVCLRRQLPRKGKPGKQERFRGVRA